MKLFKMHFLDNYNDLIGRNLTIYGKEYYFDLWVSTATSIYIDPQIEIYNCHKMTLASNGHPFNPEPVIINSH